jgi:tetratricopeptide (TPR) repeat protein
MRAVAQSPDALAALRSQVTQLHSRGNYAEALPLAEQYVALARQRFGEENIEFASAIVWLANVYNGLGRYSEAEPLYKRSLAIREKALGPDHPDAARRSTTWPRCMTTRAAPQRPSRFIGARLQSARRRWGPITPWSPVR